MRWCLLLTWFQFVVPIYSSQCSGDRVLQFDHGVECCAGGARLECSGITNASMLTQLWQGQKWDEIILRDCHLPEIDISLFNTTNVRRLEIVNCNVNRFSGNQAYQLSTVTDLSLPENELGDLDSIRTFFDSSMIQHLSLPRNHLVGSISLAGFPNLKMLDVSGNEIASLQANLSSLERLDLASNKISHIDQLTAPQLKHLDMSSNKVDRIDRILNAFDMLTTLNLSFNPLTSLTRLTKSIPLSELDVSNTEIEFVSFDNLVGLGSLEKLDFSGCKKLVRFFGALKSLPKLTHLDVSDSSLVSFPSKFFADLASTTNIEVQTQNVHFACDCRAWWSRNAKPDFFKPNSTKCSLPFETVGQAIWGVSEKLTRQNCSIVIEDQHLFVSDEHGKQFTLPCNAFGVDDDPKIRWARVIPAPEIELFSFDPHKKMAERLLERNPRMTMRFDGALVIDDVSRYDLGLYRCYASNNAGNATANVVIKINYIDRWWYLKIYSIVCGFGVALGSFALYSILGGVRRLIAWKLDRMERTSRVKVLLASIESYKQKQMESLHEKYTNKVQAIQSNYRMQMETVKLHYTGQKDKFKEYSTDRFESMSQHIGGMKDNYKMTAGAMHEYGSKQLASLWISYQAQMNKIRVFSLQQRLRLMRQYEIKHNYLEKLMKSVNIDQCRLEKQDSQLDLENPFDIPELDDEDPGTMMEMYSIKQKRYPPIDLTSPASTSRAEQAGGPPIAFSEEISTDLDLELDSISDYHSVCTDFLLKTPDDSGRNTPNCGVDDTIISNSVYESRSPTTIMEITPIEGREFEQIHSRSNSRIAVIKKARGLLGYTK